AWFGHTFQPCCNIDPITVDIAIFENNIIQIDSDTQHDPLFFGRGGLSPGHSLLQLDGATNGLCRAREFGQKSVASQLDHAPVAVCDGWSNELFTYQFKSSERA